MKVTVNSCRWQASAGQSLDSIAALFGSNYVQVRVHGAGGVRVRALGPALPVVAYWISLLAVPVFP